MIIIVSNGNLLCQDIILAMKWNESTKKLSTLKIAKYVNLLITIQKLLAFGCKSWLISNFPKSNDEIISIMHSNTENEADARFIH